MLYKQVFSQNSRLQFSRKGYKSTKLAKYRGIERKTVTQYSVRIYDGHCVSLQQYSDSPLQTLYTLQYSDSLIKKQVYMITSVDCKQCPQAYYSVYSDSLWSMPLQTLYTLQYSDSLWSMSLQTLYTLQYSDSLWTLYAMQTYFLYALHVMCFIIFILDSIGYWQWDWNTEFVLC